MIPESTASHISTETAYILPEIAELEAPLYTIIDQIAPEYDQRRYDFVVSDDRSGRIPAALVHKVLSYAHANQILRPQFICIDGQRDLASGARRMFTQWQAEYPQFTPTNTYGRRALLVTDFISSGATVRNFRRVFDAYGISYDVAAVKASVPAMNYSEKMMLPPDSSLYTPSDLNQPSRAPFIHRRKHLAGFCSEYYIPQEQLQEEREAAGSDMQILAERLIAHWRSLEGNRVIA